MTMCLSQDGSPYVLKGYSAFSFKGEQSMKMSVPLCLPGQLILIEGTTHPVTQQHIPQDLNSQSTAMVIAMFCNVMSYRQSSRCMASRAKRQS